MAIKIISIFLFCLISAEAEFPAFAPIVNPMPPSPAYTSYVKGAVCIPNEEIRYSSTVEEIVEIVQEAISRGITVKAFGHRHSTTDIICTAGIPVDMRKIQGITLNDDLTATVGAGMYLRDATDFLRQHGRALKTTPAYGRITIGGAIGTGAHGSSIKFNSSISSQVVRVTIVDGLGKVQTLTSEEDLRAFRIHLGLLGIVVNVTLSTAPLYKVRAHNYVVSDEIITNGSIIEIARNTDQVTAYWFPSFKKVVIANWTIVDVNTRGNAKTNDHVPPTSSTFNAYAAPLMEVIQKLQTFAGQNLFQGYTMQTLLTTIPDFAPIYTVNGITVRNPAVGYYDLMFAPVCDDRGFIACAWKHGPNNITFLDNEISINLESLPDFARTLKDIASKTTAIFPMQGILLRFSAKSDTYMATSHGHDAVHFEFYTMKRRNPYKNPSLGLAAYQVIMQTLAMNYSGRSHWGKTGMHYHNEEMITLKLEPSARTSFISKMNQYDPNGVFLNDFGKRLLGIGTAINSDPATEHCALLDNCVCSQDGDCARGQICTRIEGYPDYPVCSDNPSSLAILDPNAYNFNTNMSIDELFCGSNLPMVSSIDCILFSAPLAFNSAKAI